MSEADDEATPRAGAEAQPSKQRGKTVHGEQANAGHRVLAPDDAEVEAYLEVALDAPAPERPVDDRPTISRPPEPPDSVVVLDFGSQFAQLIARRVRELDVYSELLPYDTPLDELLRRDVKGVILSGGPNSVYDPGAPRPDPAIWSGRIPVLGICYGAQLMAVELGGDVMRTPQREYGPAVVSITQDDRLLAGLGTEQPVWMSHGDSITRLPAGFEATAQTDSTPCRRPGRPVARPLRHPVPPRGRAHAARPRRARQLRPRHRRGGARLDLGQLHRLHRGPHPRARRRARPRHRLGGQGHLRALRRRRFGGRRGARPSRRG